MLTIATEPNSPRHKNAFVLEASGYFGDMDESYNIETPYNNGLFVEAVFRLWERIRDDDSLRRRDQITDEDSPVLDEIPCDQGYEQLPTEVESLSLTWYDEAGTPFNVEVS